MRRLLALTLLLCALSGAAAADGFGRPYDQFLSSYEENVAFINQNDGRMLIPIIADGAFNADGCRVYRFESGTLEAEVTLDDLAVYVDSCRISLTAPEGMRHGDSRYADFTVCGLHSYALLMAMHTAAVPWERYALVTQVNEGLAGSDTYETQMGDYRLSCVREGQTVTMLFENIITQP